MGMRQIELKEGMRRRKENTLRERETRETQGWRGIEVTLGGSETEQTE